LQTLPATGGESRRALPDMEIPIQLARICKAHSELIVPLANQDKVPLINDGIDGGLGCGEERL